MNLNKLAMSLAYESIGVLAAEVVGASGFIYSQGDSAIMRDVKAGIVWTAIDQAIQYVQVGQSDLTNGSYLLVVDDAFFNTATWAAASSSGIASRVVDYSDNLPFGDNINRAVGTGVLKVSAKFLRDFLDQYYSSGPFSYISHITKLL